MNDLDELYRRNPDLAAANEGTAMIPAAVEPKRSKYGNVKTTIQGIEFASKKEADYYRYLVARQSEGFISNLECHPRYILEVNGVKIGRYTADFRYVEDDRIVVVDVKSKATKTTAYKLRKKLMLAIHGIEVQEVE